MRSFCTRALFILIAIQVILGVTWTVQNLGDVPHYGDTQEYLQLARTLKVDLYRGIAYPALLAAVNHFSGGDMLATDDGRTRGWSGFLILQLVQLMASLGCLAYSLHVLVKPVPLAVGSRRCLAIHCYRRLQGCGREYPGDAILLRTSSSPCVRRGQKVSADLSL
jgi:hypothetical protein